METRIIIAGSRKFTNFYLLEKEINSYLINKNKNEIVIISGTANGADKLGERYAAEKGLTVKKFPADWNTYGKRAGYLRNKEMAKYSCENNNKGVLFAFWDGISKGTEHMINLAEQYNLEIHIILY